MHRQKLLSYVEKIIWSMKEVDETKLKEALARWSKEYEHELNISTATMLSDVVFLIDDNNYYRSMRTEWQKIASKLSIGYFETFFDTRLSIAVQRNQQRAQSINEQVINQMWMRLEKPCGKLYHHEQNVVIIRENVDYEHVVRQIQYSFDHPLECAAVKTTVSEPMEQSKVHKMDIILRQIISKKIVAAKDCMSKQEVQSFAQILQERKKRILQQMRTCELNVPEELLANAAEELL
uniref:Uncharacterized protein n=1 Tax=Anopheles culicifacies TaxID=139723 RepID=A0A182MD29_9DIPT